MAESCDLSQVSHVMFSSSTRKWRRERVDKAEMGSAPNIVDVSPCFEALLAEAGLIMIFSPRVSSVFSMYNIVMGLLSDFMLSGNEDWRKLLRFSFTQRNTSSGFFALMLSCGGHLSRHFSLVKDHRIYEVDQLTKELCIYAYIYRFLKAFGGKCTEIEAAQVLPENVMKCHFFF